MALTIGDLVGYIRLDDSGARQGVAEAERAMQGLQRDTNGRLHDMNGRYVTESTQMGRSLGDGISGGATRARSALVGLGKVMAVTGVAIPAVAAAATSAAALAGSAAAAGIAVKAFTTAAGPQLDSVTNAYTLYSAAQDAAAQGGKQAAAAQKAYTDALAGMPAATRTTARAFIGLKSDFSAWSDSLAGTTMPVFTKGIQILRDLLPTLTPFVKAAGTALSGFLDQVSVGIKSAGFKDFATNLSALAGPALTGFLTILKNVAIGIGGMVNAFMPANTALVGGLAQASAGFATFGQGLKDSAGFAEFTQLAQAGGGTLSHLATAVLQLVVAISPLLGTTTMLITLFAQLVSAIPSPMLTVLAGVIGTVSVAMKLHATYTRAAAVATRAWAAANSAARAAATFGGWIAAAARWVAQLAVTVAQTVAGWVTMAAQAVAQGARMLATWVMMGVRAVAGAAVQAAAAATTVAGWVLMGVQSMLQAARMAAAWLIAMGPVGWIITAVVALVALIILNWSTVKAWTLAIWDWVWKKVQQAAQFMITIFLNFTLVGLIIKHWQSIKTGTVTAWNAVVNWVKTIPGRLYNLFLNFTLVGLIIKHWQAIKTGTISKATEMLTWVRGLPGRITSALGNLGNLLRSAGSHLISGFINGITSQFGSVKSTLGGLTNDLTSWKGPPSLDARILTPAGQSLIAGFQRGITAQTPSLQQQLQGLTGALPGMTAAGGMPSVGSPGNSGGPARVVIDVTGADGDMKKLIRRMVRIDGRGSVQTAFAKG